MSQMILRPCEKSNPNDDPVIIERWNGKDWSEVEVTQAFYLQNLASTKKDANSSDNKKAREALQV